MRFVGELVAVVVATDRYIAEDAADLVQVGYEELPALVDVDAATAKDADAAVNWLRSRASTYRIDPDRIAIAGYSAGAVTAIEVATPVDKVFEHNAIHASVTSDPDGIPPHIALPDATPGLVEIWDTTKPTDKREIEAWDAPFDELTERSPQARLAAKLARSVRHWIKQGARAGDVLVLVRQRGPLFEFGIFVPTELPQLIS